MTFQQITNRSRREGCYVLKQNQANELLNLFALEAFYVIIFHSAKNIMRNLSAKNLASKVTRYLQWQQGNAMLNGMCILLQFSMFQEAFKL